MDFLLHNWMLVLIALISGGMLLAPVLTGSAAAAKGLPVQEAVQKMNREKGVLIDVRDPAEFQAEHVAQAKNVPLSQLEDKLPQVVKNKNVPVLLMCAYGKRSIGAQAIAKKLGYEQAFSVAGGMAGWKSANMPLVKA